MQRPASALVIDAIFAEFERENTRREREGFPIIPRAAYRAVRAGFAAAWDEENGRPAESQRHDEAA